MRAHIIGVGSPGGDDQVGWRVIEALRASGVLQSVPCEVRVVTLDRPGTQLLGYLRGADMVLLVDAVKSGRAPGTIHRVDDVALLGDDGAISSHGFGLAATLALALELGELPATVVLYAIEIEDHCYGSTLTAAVSEAVAVAVENIAAELRACTGVRRKN